MKVHLRINDNDRSLCGMQPRYGSYDIRTIATFFQSEGNDQCGRCLHHLKRRGYSVDKLKLFCGVVSRAAVVSDRLYDAA